MNTAKDFTPVLGSLTGPPSPPPPLDNFCRARKTATLSAGDPTYAQAIIAPATIAPR